MSDIPSQLPFDWDLPLEDVDAALSFDEIQAREKKARQRLENPKSWPTNNDGQPERPVWFENYVALKDGNSHFPFRVAVLIAWLATPKKLRWPKNQSELADLLGLSSDRQFSVWRQNNPRINGALKDIWQERVIDRLGDSVDAMMEVAARADYKSRGDRELHFRLAKVLEDKVLISTGKRWEDMTVEERMDEIRKLGTSSPRVEAAQSGAAEARARAEALKGGGSDAEITNP